MDFVVYRGISKPLTDLSPSRLALYLKKLLVCLYSIIIVHGGELLQLELMSRLYLRDVSAPHAGIWRRPTD